MVYGVVVASAGQVQGLAKVLDVHGHHGRVEVGHLAVPLHLADMRFPGGYVLLF